MNAVASMLSEASISLECIDVKCSAKSIFGTIAQPLKGRHPVRPPIPGCVRKRPFRGTTTGNIFQRAAFGLTSGFLPTLEPPAEPVRFGNEA